MPPRSPSQSAWPSRPCWPRRPAAELSPPASCSLQRWTGRCRRPRLPRDPRLAVEVEDGRRYLAKTEQRWDAIALDVFFEDGIPFHTTTREFVELVRRRLEPGGLALLNVISSIGGEGSKLFRAMYRTYRSVFPTVLVHPVEGGTGYQNLILVASEQAAPSKAFLAARWQRLRATAPSAPDLRRAIGERYDREIPVDDVPILTDDYAPTDALLFG